MCCRCIDSLRECCNLKRDYLHKEKVIKLDTNMYLNETADVANKTNSSNYNNISYFRMQLVNHESVMFLKEKRMDGIMMEKYFPELVSNITENSIMCISCCESLQHYISFVRNCLNVEESIRKYCRIEGTDCKGRVELQVVVHFTSKKALKNKNNRYNLNVSKLQEKCEQIKEEYVEVEVKNENMGIEVLDLKKDINAITEQAECDRFQGNKLTRRYGSKIKAYKCQICGHQTERRHVMEKHIQKHRSGTSEIIKYKCDKVLYQIKYKHELQKHKLIQDSSEKITLHKCNVCLYQAKDRYRLQRHRLAHRRSSEATVCKCNMCGFQTMHTSILQTHFLIAHKGCKFNICRCKSKEELEIENHIRIHESSISEDIPQQHKMFQGVLPRLTPSSKTTVYKCRICGSQTKRRHDMNKHILKHRSNTTEVTKHNHEMGLYRTKYKHKHQKYKLLQKHFSEITMYKCNKCAFQTMYDCILQTHLLIAHKGHKCRICGCKTKEQLEIENHVLIQESSTSKYFLQNHKMYKGETY